MRFGKSTAGRARKRVSDTVKGQRWSSLALMLCSSVMVSFVLVAVVYEHVAAKKVFEETRLDPFAVPNSTRVEGDGGPGEILSVEAQERTVEADGEKAPTDSGAFQPSVDWDFQVNSGAQDDESSESSTGEAPVLDGGQGQEQTDPVSDGAVHTGFHDTEQQEHEDLGSLMREQDHLESSEHDHTGSWGTASSMVDKAEANSWPQLGNFGQTLIAEFTGSSTDQNVDEGKDTSTGDDDSWPDFDFDTEPEDDSSPHEWPESAPQDPHTNPFDHMPSSQDEPSARSVDLADDLGDDDDSQDEPVGGDGPDNPETAEEEGWSDNPVDGSADEGESHVQNSEGDDTPASEGQTGQQSVGGGFFSMFGLGAADAAALESEADSAAEGSSKGDDVDPREDAPSADSEKQEDAGGEENQESADPRDPREEDTPREAAQGDSGADSEITIDFADLTIEGNCGGFGKDSKFLFSTGFRAQAFQAIRGANTFYRLANSTGRVMAGPYLNVDTSFKLSRFVTETKRADDYIGNYFDMIHTDKYSNLCILSAGVDPEVLCSDPGAIVEVCIGVYCPGGGVALSESDEELDAYDDIVDTITKNKVLNDAKCLVVRNYQKGYQDPLMKRNDYAQMYGWVQETAMDASWWIHEAFQPGKKMADTAAEYRGLVGLKEDGYNAVHVRAETITMKLCKKDKSCRCSFDSAVRGAIKSSRQVFADNGRPVYLAWDASVNALKLDARRVARSKDKAKELVGADNLKVYVNFLDPLTEPLVDVMNMVESSECASYAGGHLMYAVNYLRVKRGKAPCQIFNELIVGESGYCESDKDE